MYWIESDSMGRDRLWHTCFRGERQSCPQPKVVEKWKYDEDGYFRGMIKGRKSRMFKDSPFPYNVIRCKACGEDYTW